MKSGLRLLIVEDGREYIDSFTALAGQHPSHAIELRRASSLAQTRPLLESGWPSAFFFDIVFDRIPEEELCGDLDSLIARFGGDRARAVRQLADNQGFYILDALASLLPPKIPIVLAYDFSGEPLRLEALRSRIPSLTGLSDGAGLSQVLRAFLQVPGATEGA